MAAFPVRGYKGKVEPHWGSDRGAADIFAPKGTAVQSVQGGRVVSAGFSRIGGYNVQVRHLGGLESYYAHLADAPLVEEGQNIEEGTVIGVVGDTGNAKGTGAHLHFGYGYGIQSGTGPTGGSGIGFDVTSWLRNLLGLPDEPGIPKGMEPSIPGKPPSNGGGTAVAEPVTMPVIGEGPYSGPIIDFVTTPIKTAFGDVPIPTGLGLNPGVVDAATGWVRRRLMPAIIGMLVTALGGYLVGKGDAGARLVGIELMVVGLSIVWFAYRDTTLVAWEAIKP